MKILVKCFKKRNSNLKIKVSFRSPNFMKIKAPFKNPNLMKIKCSFNPKHTEVFYNLITPRGGALRAPSDFSREILLMDPKNRKK